MSDDGKLQIYSTEASDASHGTYIVRCISGTVHIGQTFALDSTTGDASSTQFRASLQQIERYKGVFVDYFTPPHVAKVVFTGIVPAEIESGSILACVLDEDTTASL
ncbi:hypothetical protein QFZ68_003066 [Streptomyces sp. V1I6]|nr:hypothetical protein [Streptomyces sp. V1I6]